MRMKKVTKRLAALATAAVVGLGAFAGMPVTAKAADDAGIRAFVTRMYEVCLDREPDTDGLNDWSGRLASGQAQGADIAFGFIFSREFQNMNLCNEHYVNSMYEAFFGREPDASGKADWMQALSNGKTRGYVMTGFVNSQEFNNLCAGYGIVQGGGDWSGDDISVNGTCVICEAENTREVTPEITAFVERLYTCCLGRSAEADGLADWSQALAGGATGSEVASGFVFSEEYKNKNASDTAYVQMLYKTMLDRDADAAGLSDWVSQLENGSSREVVYNGFVGSTEFGNLCRNAGINVGGAIADNGTSIHLPGINRRDRYPDIPESVLPSDIAPYAEFVDEPIYTRPWPDVTGTMYADYRKTQVVKVAVYGEDEMQLIAYCGWAGDSDDSNAIMHNAICIYQGQYVIINEALFETWVNGINPEYN